MLRSSEPEFPEARLVTTITRSQSPEEQELERKLAELHDLETALAGSELVLTALKADLGDFNHRYLRVVG
jgi:hypothetical protein